MQKDNRTVFQKLTGFMAQAAGYGQTLSTGRSVDYSIPATSAPLYTFDSKEKRDKELMRMKQDKLLAHQWVKSGYDTSINQMAGANQVRLMYRDCDLMDGVSPEISTALDMYAEEACTINSKGTIINIYSKSDRVTAILQDLFINRLKSHVMIPMIARCVCKYGNEFMLMNIDSKEGVLGWRELPVAEMLRVENGVSSIYGGGYVNTGKMKPNEVAFVWEGHSQATQFKSWQVAHFRLLKDSLFLPYGTSALNKARRPFKMLSMMEDAMLLYRLERSIDRRIYKVNVGLIDDADVQPFLQEFMSNVKRAPVIDPQTGMIDLRKNFLDVSADYVIPVRSNQDPTSIETLQAGTNPTSMDDIEYMERKILAAIRVPKSYLNFQEAQGKAQNLSLMDVRYCKFINTIQQALIMELTKVAIVHLYILGMIDELTNFTITLNNPSNYIEEFVQDNMQKKLNNASAALNEQGVGLPLMSWRRVQREIMGLTDKEISEMLNEMRIEAAMANELKLTSQIIKKTNAFREADNIYGERGAQYDYSAIDGGEGGMGGGGGMPSLGGGGFGDELGDMGSFGGGEGDVSGEEETVGLENAGNGEALMESANPKKVKVRQVKSPFAEYETLLEKESENSGIFTKVFGKSLKINEEFDSTIDSMSKDSVPTIIEETDKKLFEIVSDRHAEKNEK